MRTLSAFVLVSTLATSAAATTAPGRLPFVENDFPRARATARARQLPLFVEVWAPW